MTETRSIKICTHPDDYYYKSSSLSQVYIQSEELNVNNTVIDAVIQSNFNKETILRHQVVLT